MRRPLRILALVLVAAAASGPSGAGAAESRAPIRLAAGADASQKAMSAIAGRALKKAGYKVEYVAVAPGGEVAALASGAVHAHPNLIAAQAGPALAQAIAAREVRSLGGRRGNGRNEPALKIVWAGMKSKWAGAQKLLKRMILPDEELAAIAARIDAGEVTADEAADQWMRDNRKIWGAWLTAAKNWMKP